MALQLKTDASFGGAALLNRPPIPNDAVGYVDFTTGLHMTQTADSIMSNAALVFGPVSSMKAGYYYGKDDIGYMSGTLWDRIEYGPDGECLGLRVEGDYTQRVLRAHRQDLTAGTATGALVAAFGTAPQPYQQWYSVMPSGAGAAGLQLSAPTTAATGAYVTIMFDVAGSGVVQIGSAAYGSDAFANIDLASGAVFAPSTVLAQAVRRRDGWTVYLRCVVPAGTFTDAQPYVASVAALDSPANGPSGAAFRVRAPRVMAATTIGLPPLGLWPHTTSDTHAAESLTQISGMVSDTQDFTCLFRARSGPWLAQRSAGLFLWSNNGNSGTELRFGADNGLFLIDKSSSTPRWTFGQQWRPSTIYRVGVARTAGVLAVCVNGETATVDTGAVAADASPRLLRGFKTDTNAWAGHLQKCIWWSDGRGASDVAALVERWL